MSKTGEYYDFVSEIVLRHMNDELEKENKEETMDDAMIRASNKAGITSTQLLNVLVQHGVIGVYNLGMKHMYEYLEDKNV